MTILAYILLIVFVPTISAMGGFINIPLTLLFASTAPRITSVITGLITGFIAAWGASLIFGMCEVFFSATPLWVVFVLFFLNDMSRFGRNGSDLALIFEMGNLIGTPLGIYIWATNYLNQ